MFHGFIPHVMGTRLDVLMIHTDSAHLNRLWLEIIQQLESLDKMLNRFDARSEVAQLNSRSSQNTASISRELEAILQQCSYYYESTLHLFDVTLKDFSRIQLHGNQCISSTDTTFSFDFGGFAKGYALQLIREILEQGDIRHAFVDFGNSSIMGIGHHPYGDCWKVSLLNPYNRQPLDEFNLMNATLSTSGNTLQYSGHIVNPLTGMSNKQKMMATILSANPLDAEILSTVWMIADEKQREQIKKNFSNIKETIYTL